MKRFAAIVMIVVVVLAMSVGTAFASVCVGGSCDGRMLCPTGASISCPMADGGAMLHSSCDHRADVSAKDAVSAAAGADHYAVTSALYATPVPCALSGASSALIVQDARGAPHLTTVIRI